MSQTAQTEECLHLLDPGTCAICNKTPDPGVDVDWDAEFSAKYEGWCQSGDHRIDPGDRIVRRGGRYHHPECLIDRR